VTHELDSPKRYWLSGKTTLPHPSFNYRLENSRSYVRVVCNPRETPFNWYDNQYENSTFDADFRMALLLGGNGVCSLMLALEYAGCLKLIAPRNLLPTTAIDVANDLAFIDNAITTSCISASPLTNSLQRYCT
jgi:hypothetical protein